MLQTWAYVSLDPTDTQHRVGTVLRRHNLRVQGASTAFRASLEHLGDEQLSVTRLSYGSSVVVEPVPEPGFWVLSMPLQGEVKVTADSGRVDSRPGVASMIPSSGEVRGHWMAGSRQAVLRIREELLWDACDGLADDPDGFLRESSPVLHVGHHTGLLAGLLQTLATLDFRQHIHLPQEGAAMQWSAMARLIAGSVVCARLSQRHGLDAGSASASRLYRVQGLLRDMVHAEDTVSVATLAARAGMSVRALQHLLQSQAGMTVVQAIRDVKLLRARELLGAGHASVSEVALACGFQHLGRFAAMYAKRFGHLPSQEQPAMAAVAWSPQGTRQAKPLQ
ncbi:MAG: AraC family transcriptional regulator [Haliea sp.]|nr:MAG: AraC family transcriptional regulator [Haliea sp.]